MLAIQRTLCSLMILGIVGCVTRGDIDDVRKGQADILAKLDQIEKSTRAQQRPPQPPPGPPQPDQSKVYGFPIGNAAIEGPKDALVTIVEISDFQCPFCARGAQTLKEVANAYKKDVRFVFKHNPLPFHNRALPAAVAAECAGKQHKFWAMHDKIFAGQKSLEDADLEKYAKEAGADIHKWKKCFAEDESVKDGIKADAALSAKFGVRGTPGFFINGRFISGAQPLPVFKAIIDEELKKAKDSKVAPASYYAQEIEGKGLKSL